jgi:hypothetical protein
LMSLQLSKPLMILDSLQQKKISLKNETAPNIFIVSSTCTDTPTPYQIF